VAVVSLSGCSDSVIRTVCDVGISAARNDHFRISIQLLNKCLSYKALSPSKKATAFQSRAWAHSSLKSHSLAVQDQEDAFKLIPATEHFELINYASYLRSVNRFKDSLIPLYDAVEMDKKSGHLSMMTQYNLGWSLYELGKYEDSINEFTKGISRQPDYPFVYLRRGLSYHYLDLKIEAGEDFKKFIALLGDNDIEFPVEFKKEIDTVLAEYNLADELS